MLDAFAAALAAPARLPRATLRQLEADWRWAAVHDCWDAAADDCTPAGAALLACADSVDGFLAAARPLAA